MRFFPLRAVLTAIILGVCLTLTATTNALAQSADPFENGWTLDADNSELRFMSIKKGSKAETHKFATLSGLITETGKVQIRVLLDSVDTSIDLRNVRMRFLFFETFLHPEATVIAQLDPSLLTDLHTTRRNMVNMTYTLTLRGISIENTAEVAVTLISNDRVTVSTTTPIVISLSDFDLETGHGKLQDAANVVIVPLGIVSFDFVFDRSSPGTPPMMASIMATIAPGSAALETKGNLGREECVGRFEILSRAGNIYFTSGSTNLANKSKPLLDNLYDIVDRCPDLLIEIGGHTDSDGNSQFNRTLSERRARSVSDYLATKGISQARMKIVGYGEEQPLVPNSNRANKAKNRRIEFSVLN